MSSRTFIEFFAGIGLIHQALHPAGWRAVLANDNNPKKQACYAANFPKVPFRSDDVRALELPLLPQVQLVTASFPCIDLSQAGGRVGINGQKSGVVWAFLEQVAELHRRGTPPEFMLIENVPGLLSLHEGRSIDALLRRIAELGYCVDLIQVDARHFVPQSRNRVFVIGVLGERPRICSAEWSDDHIRRYKAREAYERNRHLPWACFDFPELPTRKLRLSDIVERLPPTDKRWWDASRMEEFWAKLEHHHRPQLEEIAASGKTVYMTAVRRGRRRRLREQIINLRFDGLASCVRTPGGGSSTQLIVEVKGGVVRARRILGVEAARLQGVCLPGEPGFVLPDVSETDQLHGFGDAVCVPAVRWVMEHSIERLIAGHQTAARRKAVQMSINYGAGA